MSTMAIIECACVAIIGLWFAFRLAWEPDRPALLGRLALLACASWLAENTVIHAYGFYGYSAGWSVFVDRVPLMILLIWPVVIHSAWDLARHLGPALSGPRTALVAAALVLADASLIEPIAVHSGLWSWTEPGLFAVPPIGILGWAIFAGFAVALFERARRQAPGQRRFGPLTALAVFTLPAALTHLVLLAVWWGALRWLNHTVPPWPAVALAWTLSLTLAAWAWARDAHRRVPTRDLALRIPAAAFFFVLLALHGQDAPPLIAWSIAFAPPYLVLTRP
ncbi:MAG: carotenoid biosynthesis protein [Deltaproteobacteria bacterium]|nr:carotenoid biosynthesis protein [Deltaproteobacteria bacterium]